jgi:hypothetical protein
MIASAPKGNGAPVLMRKIELSGRRVDRGCVSDVKTLYIPGGSLAISHNTVNKIYSINRPIK